MKRFYDRHPELCVFVITVSGLIILTAMIAGIYIIVEASAPFSIATTLSTPLTTPSLTPPFLDENEGLLTYDAICVPQYQKPSSPPMGGLEECVVGSSPREDSCSGNGTCTIYSYAFDYSANEWRFKDRTATIPMTYDAALKPAKNTTRLYCQTAGGELGLCDGSICVEAAVEDDRSWYNESKWVDNCDKQNPCWQYDIGRLVTISREVSRDACLRGDDAVCWSDEPYSTRQAVVWMQHVRCESGKNSTTNVPCSGIPLRLWVCTKCKFAYETSHQYYDRVCDTENREIISPCAFRCQRKSSDNPPSEEYLLDGVDCLNSSVIDKKYCYGGRCFPMFAELNDQNRHEILTEDQCRRKRQRRVAHPKTKTPQLP